MPFNKGDRVKYSAAYLERFETGDKWHAKALTKRGTVVRVTKKEQPVILWDGNAYEISYHPRWLDHVPAVAGDICGVAKDALEELHPGLEVD